LFTNFVHRILNQVHEAGVDLVLLNSREGFLLQELYTRIAGALPETNFPPAQYAYLTRKSIYAASLKAFGDREIDMGFHTITPSLRNMFIRYSLPANELEKFALAAGFKSLDDELHDPWSSPELKTLINDPGFLAVMHSTRETAAAIVYDYLEQIGYWDCRKVAMVDVGWNGTTQEALSLAFSHLDDSPEIAGFYMALLGQKQFKATTKSKFTGIYHDYRDNGLSTPFSRFVELFETTCRAPHATVIGFKRNSTGRVLPVFKKRDSLEFQQEQKDDALIASIQCGVLDYADDYVRTMAFHDRDPAVYSDFILYKIDRLMRYPTQAEAEVLTSFSHSEDFGLSLVHVPKSKQLNPVRQRVLWREASMVNGPLPGLNMLFNFYRLIRTRRY
jgi:predicted HAD superfamily hydrolase